MFSVTMTVAPGGTPVGTCVMQPLYLCGLVSVNEHGPFPVICLFELLEKLSAKLCASFKISASFKIQTLS